MLVAVLAALAAGCTFAVGSVLQQMAARDAPPEVALSWRLLAYLVRRPRWLAGIGCDVGSFGLQALALGFGPISLVQPLLVTGVLFAVPLAVWWRGMRLGATDWIGTAAVAGGLTFFLVAASPAEGSSTTSFAKWVLILIAVGGLMLLAVAAGKAARGAARASLFALAAGVAFGLLAALTKESVFLLGKGAGTFFTAWQPYAMLGVAIAGAIVQQSAFQAGPLQASVPVMDAVEPTIAVLIGVFAFGEHLATSVGSLAAQAFGIVAVLTGVVLLDRSPVVLQLQKR
ncbi:MAG TPA: DMT family transporter [Mycobacteriales bacterium]|nr:DMT family transporter [Mycobacteriales bacterium]